MKKEAPIRSSAQQKRADLFIEMFVRYFATFNKNFLITVRSFDRMCRGFRSRRRPLFCKRSHILYGCPHIFIKASVYYVIVNYMRFWGQRKIRK